MKHLQGDNIYALVNIIICFHDLTISLPSDFFVQPKYLLVFNFVSGISHLPYQAFRWRFLNIERHNKQYQDHFFKDFLGRAHCPNTCDICIEHDSTYHCYINYELSCLKVSTYKPDNSKFRPFAHSYEQDDQLFQSFTPAVPYHK